MSPMHIHVAYHCYSGHTHTQNAVIQFVHISCTYIVPLLIPDIQTFVYSLLLLQWSQIKTNTVLQFLHISCTHKVIVPLLIYTFVHVISVLPHAYSLILLQWSHLKIQFYIFCTYIVAITQCNISHFSVFIWPSSRYIVIHTYIHTQIIGIDSHIA